MGRSEGRSLTSCASRQPSPILIVVDRGELHPGGVYDALADAPIRESHVPALLDGRLPQITRKTDLQVTERPNGPDAGPRSAHPRGEVVWIVVAREPARSEPIGQLP